MKNSPRKIVRNTQPTNQKSERLWKYIVRSIRDRNDSTVSEDGNKRAALWENKMEKEAPRFPLLKETIHDFMDDQENKNTRAKTDRGESPL